MTLHVPISRTDDGRFWGTDVLEIRVGGSHELTLPPVLRPDKTAPPKSPARSPAPAYD
jgi:hypothetical protein